MISHSYELIFFFAFVVLFSRYALPPIRAFLREYEKRKLKVISDKANSFEQITLELEKTKVAYNNAAKAHEITAVRLEQFKQEQLAIAYAKQDQNLASSLLAQRVNALNIYNDARRIAIKSLFAGIRSDVVNRLKKQTLQLDLLMTTIRDHMQK